MRSKLNWVGFGQKYAGVILALDACDNHLIYYGEEKCFKKSEAAGVVSRRSVNYSHWLCCDSYLELFYCLDWHKTLLVDLSS